ncbi:exosortase F system-associated membrane protein [Flavobacterium cellulosilyticum]|uniref:Exosortase F system-associated protein n=1 Tax=Flavobacterium cellulosilyticum TaxID=2541731 RepID=A0A4R5C6J9_9FLAO|nr:exosortase F system-associated protein [Flavobacterium cellulosilyticum]TDD93743.1 exosortase F system-associated protein [Flavobacterium cellulosilyticum]
MLQKILNHKIRSVFAFFIVLLLIMIRAYEDVLFYDPFLNFFKMDYHNLEIPEINKLKLFFGILYRYFLNSFLSLAIIYVLFKDIEGLKFAAFLYFIFFIVLIVVFFLILFLLDEPNKMVLFYIRRFLIQPILLLLFLPAFYYQKGFN